MRYAETFIVVREGHALTGAAVASALVPCDEFIANVEHGHDYAVRAVGLGIGFGEFEELPAKAFVHGGRGDGEHSEIDMTRFIPEEDAGLDGAGLSIAEAEDEGGFGGGEFAFEIIGGGPLAVDEIGFVGPAFAAAIGGVDEAGDFGEIGGLGGSDVRQVSVWHLRAREACFRINLSAEDVAASSGIGTAF